MEFVNKIHEPNRFDRARVSPYVKLRQARAFKYTQLHSENDNHSRVHKHKDGQNK